MKYEIEGLTIKKQSLDDPKYRYITYTSLLCEITIATDDMGTHICYNGVFFGGSGFLDLEMAVIYLRYRTKAAKRLFRQVYINNLKYKLSWRSLKHQWWLLRTHFSNYLLTLISILEDRSK